MTDQMERNRRDLDRTRSFIKHAKEAREERSSFAKVLIGMIIVFIGIILSIFVLADNENFLEEHPADGQRRPRALPKCPRPEVYAAVFASYPRPGHKSRRDAHEPGIGVVV